MKIVAILSLLLALILFCMMTFFGIMRKKLHAAQLLSADFGRWRVKIHADPEYYSRFWRLKI